MQFAKRLYCYVVILLPYNCDILYIFFTHSTRQSTVLFISSIFAAFFIKYKKELCVHFFLSYITNFLFYFLCIAILFLLLCYCCYLSNTLNPLSHTRVCVCVCFDIAKCSKKYFHMVETHFLNSLIFWKVFI